LPDIEVPAQVSIAGFDDLDISAQVNLALTAMYVLSEEVGCCAVSARLSRQLPARVRFEVNLVERCHHWAAAPRFPLRAAEMLSEFAMLRDHQRGARAAGPQG
jgi:hypothetical protein